MARKKRTSSVLETAHKLSIHSEYENIQGLV